MPKTLVMTSTPLRTFLLKYPIIGRRLKPNLVYQYYSSGKALTRSSDRKPFCRKEQLSDPRLIMPTGRNSSGCKSDYPILLI